MALEIACVDKLNSTQPNKAWRVCIDTWADVWLAPRCLRGTYTGLGLK